ncbi:AAA family ATPase [Priestia megaterium]|uniref:AAA family ATPase n=1 Tax=Priestia megaterium TaxID=1404 RepID=UPI0039F6F7DA
MSGNQYTAEMLLSKIIDQNDVNILTRYNVEESHFTTKGEKQAYLFIKDYATKNDGNAPSPEVLSANVDEFTYYANISDDYGYLVRQTKDYSAKVEAMEFLQNEAPRKFEEMDGKSFLEWLQKSSEQAIIRTSVRESVGKTLEDLGGEMLTEYQNRKQGKSAKLWKTPYERLNEAIGGFYSGDIYGVIAESGRGKSYLIIRFIHDLLKQGANILVKSYELKAYLWLSRLVSVLTAEEGDILDENNRKVGLPNKQILSGRLEGETEEYFTQVVTKLNSFYPGNLYLQAKGDKDLTRSLKELDSELYQRPDIDVVVVDPFYGLDDVYGRNSNRTAGGAAEQAARYFEQVVGKHDVVGIYAVQATVEKKQRDEDEGGRELKLPTRDQVKTSKALLEIATILFSFDNDGDGQAQLGIEKGRNGGEDVIVDLIALLDYGVLRELETGQAAASQFDF